MAAAFRYCGKHSCRARLWSFGCYVVDYRMPLCGACENEALDVETCRFQHTFLVLIPHNKRVVAQFPSRRQCGRNVPGRERHFDVHSLRLAASHLAIARTRLPQSRFRGRSWCFYSARRAAIGSSREARQAGIRQAAAATNDSMTMTDTNTEGSSGRIPYNMERISCAASTLAATPSASPT